MGGAQMATDKQTSDKQSPAAAAGSGEGKAKALSLALETIEKQFGKGSIMKLGESSHAKR